MKTQNTYCSCQSCSSRIRIFISSVGQCIGGAKKINIFFFLSTSLARRPQLYVVHSCSLSVSFDHILCVSKLILNFQSELNAQYWRHAVSQNQLNWSTKYWNRCWMYYVLWLNDRSRDVLFLIIFIRVIHSTFFIVCYFFCDVFSTLAHLKFSRFTQFRHRNLKLLLDFENLSHSLSFDIILITTDTVNQKKINKIITDVQFLPNLEWNFTPETFYAFSTYNFNWIW